MSNMTSSYIKVIVIEVVTLALLYVLQVVFI